MLGALEPPSQGRVTLDGQNPFELAAAALADFRNAQHRVRVSGSLPAAAVHACSRTCSCRRWSPQESDSDDAARARACLEQVGLGERLDHRPGELSGGEKQRAAIARALVRQPRLVLCDEPTGNLDQASAATVASMLLDLHATQRNILIVVTHSERLAAQFPIRFDISDGKLRRVE